MTERSFVEKIINCAVRGEIDANGALSMLDADDCKDNICVACSGGCDSTYLVLHLLKIFKNISKRLVVLHFNHNMRGECSDGDEDFAKKISSDHGLMFFSEKLAVKLGHATEGVLRHYRNDFFSRAMAMFSSRVLVTGHQKNDVAETLIMRLLRASDTAGLSAPRDISVFNDGTIRIRPLIGISKDDIKLQLMRDGIEWREDASNSSNDYFRNKIRNIVIPELQQFSNDRDVVGSLCIAKKNIEEANAAVEFFAEKFFKKREKNRNLHCDGFQQLPVAVLKKIFSKFLFENGIVVRKSYIEKMVSVARSQTEQKISAGTKYIEFRNLMFSISFTDEHDGGWCIDNVCFGNNALPTGRCVNIDVVEIDKENFFDEIKRIDVTTQCYASVRDPTNVDTNIEIKNFLPNYRYKRFGHKSCKKLGDLVSSTSDIDKNELPVIFIEKSICWVPGLPVADDFRVNVDAKTALLLTYF